MSRVRRAALALLPDAETAAWARRTVLELDERFSTGYAAGSLPPHISLKQPFAIDGLPALRTIETFAAELAARTAPVPVRLGAFATWRPSSGASTAWVSVQDGGRLAALHADLDRELPHVLGAPADAPFDDEYVPHLTVAHGGDPAAHDAIEQELAGSMVDRAAQLERLHLFAYRQEHGVWSYLDLVGFPLRG